MERQHECNASPSVGAWIEILLFSTRCRAFKVAPLAGAWIEIKHCDQYHLEIILRKGSQIRERVLRVLQ